MIFHMFAMVILFLGKLFLDAALMDCRYAKTALSFIVIPLRCDFLKGTWDSWGSEPTSNKTHRIWNRIPNWYPLSDFR